MDIVGRIVSGDLDLLRFLYPDYEVIRDEVPMFPSRNAIYAGDAIGQDDFINTYRKRGLKFIIYNRHQPEINLNNRFTLLSIVFKKYNRYVPKYVYNMMNTLDDDTFIELCKYYWILGEWLLKEVDYEKTFLDFVATLNMSTRDVVTSYLNLVSSMGTYRIESSLLTFLIRCRDRDYKGRSIIYNRMLNNFKTYKLEQSKRGIKESFKYNIDNTELRLLNMIIKMIG